MLYILNHELLIYHYSYSRVIEGLMKLHIITLKYCSNRRNPFETLIIVIDISTILCSVLTSLLYFAQFYLCRHIMTRDSFISKL